MSFPTTQSSELTKKILEILENGGTSRLKLYLDSIDAEKVSNLLDPLPATNKETHEYKVYTYNNPFRNKVIFKTEFWREWINNNPNFTGLFLETDPKTGNEFVVMPSLGDIGIVPPSLEVGKIPLGSDFQLFYTQVQLEITKLRDINKDLTNQLDIFKGKEKVKDEIHQDVIKLKNERVSDLEKNLKEEQTKIVEIGKKLVTKEGQLIKEAADWEIATQFLRNNLKVETKARAESERKLQDEIDAHRDYRNKRDVELFEKTQEIIQLRLILTGKESELQSVSVKEKQKLKEEYEARSLELNNKIEGYKNKLKYLENESLDFTSTIVGEFDLIKTKQGLAKMEKVFGFVELKNTWNFVKEGYEQLIQIEEVTTNIVIDPIDIKTAEEVGKFGAIKSGLIKLLGEINWSISSENWETKTSFKFAIDKIENESVSRVDVLSDIRSFLQARPNLLVEKPDVLSWLNLWEDLEGITRTIASRVASDNPYWATPSIPSRKPTPDTTTPIEQGTSPIIFSPPNHSGVSTPEIIDIVSPHVFRNQLEIYLENIESEINNYIEWSVFDVELPFTWQNVSDELRVYEKEKWEKKIKNIIQEVRSNRGKAIMYDNGRIDEVVDKLSKILTDVNLDVVLDKSWLTIDNVKNILEKIEVKTKYTKKDWIKEINDLKQRLGVDTNDLNEGVNWEIKLNNKDELEIEDYAKGILRNIYQKKGQPIPDKLKEPEIIIPPKDKLTQWKEEIDGKFTEDLIKKWEDLGIDKEKAKVWLGNKTGFPIKNSLIIFSKGSDDDRLAPSDIEFVKWLVEGHAEIYTEGGIYTGSSDWVNPQWHREQPSKLTELYKEWKTREPKTFYFSPFISDEYQKVILDDTKRKNLKLYQKKIKIVLDDKYAYINCEGSNQETQFKDKRVEEGILVLKDKCKNEGGWEKAKELILKYPSHSDKALQLKTTKIVWLDKGEGGFDETLGGDVMQMPSAEMVRIDACLFIVEEFEIIEVKKTEDEKPIKRGNLTKENVEYILNNLEV